MATPADPLKNYIDNLYDTVTYYTASLSPFSQGVSLRQPWQLSAFTNLKIRGNHNFVTTVDRVAQHQDFFDETFATENLGTHGTGSQVNIDSVGLLGEEITHRIELRDFGTSVPYDNDLPYEESDPIDPVAFLEVNPIRLTLPYSMVLTSTPESFDGVIEPLEIRRVVDRSSIEMPYIARSIKGSLGITNVKRESFFITDKKDLRDDITIPFLDSTETKGNVDIPGAFSDAESHIAPFTDTSDRMLFYSDDSGDTVLKNTLIYGFVSGSVTYRAARPNDVRDDIVVSRHGFVFSQNDNYGYDSIAFGGLKK